MAATAYRNYILDLTIDITNTPVLIEANYIGQAVWRESHFSANKQKRYCH